MSADRGEYAALEQGENNNAVAPKSYRNRIVSVVSVALVMTGGAFLVANSRGSVTSSSVTNLAKASTAPQQAKALPLKVDMDRKEVKGVEAKKGDEKKDVESREEVDGGKPVSKKTAKPTVKPTTPPKPTVPPTTKKPSEKKDVKEVAERVDGPKGMTKKSAANADKGLNPPARQLVGLSSMPPKKGDAPKEEKKGDEPREEVDGGKPVKKTAKPTVKPTAPPKPTVPPSTKKPAEKHAVLDTEEKHASSDARLDGPKGMDHKSENNAKAGMAPPARSLSSQEFGGPKKSASTPIVSSMKASVLDLFGGKSGKTKKPTSAPTFEPLGGKPTPIPWTGKPAEAPTGKHAVEEKEAPKEAKESTMDREEGPKGMSKATIKKENGGFTPPRQLENRKEAPAPKEAAPMAKKDTMTPPKKAEAPKEEKKEAKKDVEPREEVDGGKPVAKKTAKPTVKPTTPPKPTVPPTTKKPSEKKDVKEEVHVEGPKLHPSRMLAEVRGKINPSSSSTRGKGKTEKPVEGPPGPQPEPRGPRELSAVPVTDAADPCHDGLSPRCTPPTSKPVEHHRMLTEKTASSVSQAAKNAIYGLSGPTKSPSTGLHKPTWKPTAGKPTGKPLEQGASKTIASKSDATSEAVAEEQAKNEATPATATTKSSSSSSKAASSSGNKKVLMHDGAPSRQLSETASVPTKSPSSGLHKPTWKPSSKPAEQESKTEEVVVVEDTTTTTTTTASADTTTKTVNTNREAGPKGATKKLAHDGAPTTRYLAQSHPGDLTTSIAGKGAFAEVGPSKSPSTGIHKPTWKPTQGKPTGKPVEPWKEGVESSHTEMKNSAHVDGELEKAHPSRELKAVEPKDEKADPCHDGLSPRCTPPTSKPVEHHVKRSLAGSPTKSPSSGLHKPTWRPSSKPAEHRALQKDEKADPCHDGLSPRCTPPTNKPVEHRSLAGSPTKSPSSGLHKPTWKPSSKPAEHRQ